MKKCNLLIIITLFAYISKSFAEDVDPVFSVIDRLPNSENTQDTLPNTYEESTEDDASMHNEAYLREKTMQNANDSASNANNNIYKDSPSAKVTVLNKITAKSQAMIVKVGEAKFFGNIEIKVHRCLKSTDQYQPENKILLSITENKVDEDQVLLFQGWMMSSNISASTFEHAVYEVFSEECL